MVAQEDVKKKVNARILGGVRGKLIRKVRGRRIGEKSSGKRTMEVNQES